jgi:cytochrome bd-type quinol oxidase subunit 2
MINIFAAFLMIVVILLAMYVGNLVYEFRQEKENEKIRKITRLQMIKDEKEADRQTEQEKEK